MSKKRDIIQEIIQKRIRSGISSRHNYLNRFDSIQALFNKKTKSLPTINEITRYIPLAAISTTEAYFRSTYKALIDYNNSYLSNAIKYFKESNNKFDIDLLNAMSNKLVSAGDIISHQLQLNNLTDAVSTLNSILDIDFLSEIKKNTRFKRFFKYPKMPPLNTNFGLYKESIDRLYEYRHILSHEFAVNMEMDGKGMEIDCKRLFYFIESCDNFFGKLLNENQKNGQQIQNRFAVKQFTKKEKELSSLIRTIVKRDKVRDDFREIGNYMLFEKSFKTWKEFRHQQAVSISDSFKGGTLAGLIYWTQMEIWTQLMIDDLKYQFSRNLENNIIYR